MKKVFLTFIVMSLALAAFGFVPRYNVRFDVPSLHSRPATMSKDVKRTYAADKLGLRQLKTQSEGSMSLYGYMGYSDSESFQAGLYNLSDSGYELKWLDPIYTEAGLVFNTGWEREGKVCGLMPFYYLGELLSVLYISYDIETGMPVDFIDQDISDGVFEIAAYNSTDDMIYGYGFDSKGDWKFMRAPADNPFAYKVIKDITRGEESEICSALTFNVKDKMLYGVNADGKFVRISANGLQTEVMSLSEYVLDYISGLCYSENEDVFYWNASLKEPGSLSAVSYLYSIDVDNSSTKELYEYENTEEFMFFFTHGDKPDPNAPEAPVINKIFFEGISASGTLQFDMPAFTSDKSPLSDQSEWIVSIDGIVYKSAKAMPGENVTVNLDSQTSGLHQLTVYVESDGMKGRADSKNFFVGKDVPAAPANVKLTKDKVTWDAVDSGINGGYVDSSSIRYNVYINNVHEVTTDDTFCSVSIPDNQPLRAWRAYVTAEADGLVSDPAFSNTIVEGVAMKLPVTILPSEEQASLCTVSDVNNDGYTWTFNPDIPCFESDYSEDGPMNDWFFLPAMDFSDSEKMYRISLDASLVSAKGRNEYLEIKYGTQPAPEGMTVTLFDKFTPFSENWERYVEEFNVPQAGKGYIGFHSMSEADQYGVRIKNVTVQKTSVTSQSPAAVSDLEAKSAGLSQPAALVSFKMPVNTVGGTKLTCASLRAMISTAKGDTEVSGVPGETVKTTVDALTGWNTISVRVFDGEAEGPESVAKVYCGLDVPAPVGNLVSVEYPDMMKVSMSWDAPTVGFNGGEIDGSEIQYEIYKLSPTLMGYNWQLIDKVKDTEYTYACEEGAPQEVVQLGVLPVNSMGDCARIASITAILGTPVCLPFVENFDGPYGPVNDPWLIYTPDESYIASWGFGDFNEYLGFGEGKGIIGDTGQAETRGRLGIPRISTRGMKRVDVKISFLGGDSVAETSLLGECFGMTKPDLLSEVPASNDLLDVSFALPLSMLDKEWVQIYIDALFHTSNSYVAVSSIRIEGESSGISDLKRERVDVFATNGAIGIVTGEDSDALVYSIDGRIIASTRTVNGAAHINVENGVYVVFVNQTAYKITVN